MIMLKFNMHYSITETWIKKEDFYETFYLYTCKQITCM
jgi:hypothetical protein